MQNFSAITEVLIECFYSKKSWFTTFDELSAERREEINRNSSKRYLEFRRYLNWTSKALDLSSANVLEYGCSVGSSTQAIAENCKSLTAIDINKDACMTTAKRLKICGLEGHTNVVYLKPNAQVSGIDALIPDASLDAVFMYAVLEHMLHEEKIIALKQAYKKLKDGGTLIIGETPNALSYFDIHTTQLNFFHQSSDDTMQHHLNKSNRKELVAALSGLTNINDFKSVLNRWGTGVSFLDFEIALGPSIHKQIVYTGYEPDALSIRPVRPEDFSLLSYFVIKNLQFNICFSKSYLDFILIKGANTSSNLGSNASTLIQDNFPNYRNLLFPESVDFDI